MRRALGRGVREAGLFMSRKNGKSSLVAVLLLAHLAGPLRRAGWRGAVASLSREKTTELWALAKAVGEASALPVRFGKVPRVMEGSDGLVTFLSADATAGHGGGYDMAVVDETGLFPERGRGLVQGLLSSTSAKDGRVIHISVLGDSPLTAELVGRADDRSVHVEVYQAPEGCALDDQEAWEMANPGLDGVKSRDYMADMARRAAALPSEQPAFRVFDLNQPGNAGGGLPVVDLDSWNRCAERPKPERAGVCFVGIDLGGSTSMTAAAAYWPATGRLDCWGGFGDNPNLQARGEADGVGRRYLNMEAAGELRTWPGRVAPVAEFLAWVASHLEGESVARCLADRYRQAEAADFIEDAGLPWPMEWRAQGAGRDGSADVRAFQRSAEGGTLRPGESLLMRSAVAESELRFDGNGNPGLEKGRQRGRIDVLAAAVLAVGAGSRRQAEVLTFHESELDGGDRQFGDYPEEVIFP